MKRGFSLIELLLVVAIIGVMLAVVTPEFAGGIGGTKLQMAAQGVMHMSRYARSMAVLQQQPAYVSFGSNGVLRVSTQTKTAPVVAPPVPEPGAEGAAPPAETAETETAAPKTQEGSSVSQPETEELYKGIIFVAEYTDDVDRQRGKSLLKKDSPVAEDVVTGRVLYRSNGTCRPYRVTITTDEEEESARGKLVVEVDMLGQGHVLGNEP